MQWSRCKKDPVPEFTPIRFKFIERHTFNTEDELHINTNKAVKEGFIIDTGYLTSIGYWLDLYRDPRKEKS